MGGRGDKRRRGMMASPVRQAESSMEGAGKRKGRGRGESGGAYNRNSGRDRSGSSGEIRVTLLGQ